MYKNIRISMNREAATLIEDFDEILELPYIQKIINQKLIDNQTDIRLDINQSYNGIRGGDGCKIFACYVGAFLVSSNNDFTGELCLYDMLCAFMDNDKEIFITIDAIVDCLYDVLFGFLDYYYCMDPSENKKIWEYYPMTVVKNYFNTNKKLSFLLLDTTKDMVMLSYYNEEDTSIIPCNKYFEELERHDIIAIQSYISSNKLKHVRLLCNIYFSMINDSLLKIYCDGGDLDNLSTSTKLDILRISTKTVWFKCIIHRMKILYQYWL